MTRRTIIRLPKNVVSVSTAGRWIHTVANSTDSLPTNRCFWVAAELRASELRDGSTFSCMVCRICFFR